MLKEKKRSKLYRIIIIFSLYFLLCFEGYIFLVNFRNVTVQSFDVEIASPMIEINEDKRTFKVSNDSGSFVRTSKEYKAVLSFSWDNIVVIDVDNQLKVLDINENSLVAYNNFSLSEEDITSTTLSEDQNIIKVNLIGKDFNKDYCYNKDTKETYVVDNN
jgi:hypothetical protein